MPRPLPVSGGQEARERKNRPVCSRVTLSTVPGKRTFEEQIAALDGLRQQSPESCIEPLRKALGHRNNFVVGKAADLVREFRLDPLIPELLTAFDRFFENPIKSDPQCWAKNALSRALAAFEHEEAETFLRGMRHIQLEPVWGGRSDTAGTLRATCALALVQCRSLPEPNLLAHLVELFADQDKSVRVEVARAIEQVGSPSAVLLLRLREHWLRERPDVPFPLDKDDAQLRDTPGTPASLVTPILGGESLEGGVGAEALLAHTRTFIEEVSLAMDALGSEIAAAQGGLWKDKPRRTACGKKGSRK